MPGPAVRVDGVDEVRRSLKAAGAKSSTLSKAHRRVGKLVEGESRRGAGGGTPQQRSAAKVLLGKGTAREAALAIRNTNKVPYGLGAFLGGKRPQFPDWVGNRWDILGGSGPYVIADAMRSNRDEILEEYESAVLDAFRAAGLDVGDIAFT